MTDPLLSSHRHLYLNSHNSLSAWHLIAWNRISPRLNFFMSLEMHPYVKIMCYLWSTLITPSDNTCYNFLLMFLTRLCHVYSSTTSEGAAICLHVAHVKKCRACLFHLWQTGPLLTGLPLPSTSNDPKSTCMLYLFREVHFIAWLNLTYHH